MALELERAANHTGDLGAMAGDVGFLPTSSFCGRIRGDWLNMTAEACGSRLGRDWLRPGGLRIDLDSTRAQALAERLERAWADTRDAVELMWGAASVLNRFEAAGAVDPVLAREIGLVGVPARACGIALDVRRDHPFGPYAEHPVAPGLAEAATSTPGPGCAGWSWPRATRSCVRPWNPWPGASRSPGRPLPPLAPASFWVSLAEGWRGEVLHLAVTDGDGPVPPLQDRRPLLPQLVRPGPGAAGRADLGLPPVQQELQPLLLRT